MGPARDEPASDARGEAHQAGMGEDFREVNGLPLRRPSSCTVPVFSRNKRRVGRLRFLGAGRRDGHWAEKYNERVQRFDWSDFYARWAGAAYIDFFREDLTEGQTVVLVDSRTGVTEQGGICTHHLADLVVLLSGPNDINVEGTRWMADILANADVAELRRGRLLQALPVAARVETASQAEELGCSASSSRLSSPLASPPLWVTALVSSRPLKFPSFHTSLSRRRWSRGREAGPGIVSCSARTRRSPQPSSTSVWKRTCPHPGGGTGWTIDVSTGLPIPSTESWSGTGAGCPQNTSKAAGRCCAIAT
jgi:hypothetical protein